MWEGVRGSGRTSGRTTQVNQEEPRTVGVMVPQEADPNPSVSSAALSSLFPTTAELFQWLLCF